MVLAVIECRDGIAVPQLATDKPSRRNKLWEQLINPYLLMTNLNQHIPDSLIGETGQRCFPDEFHRPAPAVEWPLGTSFAPLELEVPGQSDYDRRGGSE